MGIITNIQSFASLRMTKRDCFAALAMTFVVLFCHLAYAGDPLETIEEAKAFVETIVSDSTNVPQMINAIQQLKERGGEGAELLLIEWAKNQTEDENVRASAVEALGSFSSERVIEAVKGFEKDPSPFLQLACRKARWVHSGGTDLFTSALFEENRMSKDPEVIKEILWQLKNFPPEFNHRDIVENAWWDKISNPDPENGTPDPYYFLQAIKILFEMEQPADEISLFDLSKVIDRLTQFNDKIAKRFFNLMKLFCDLNALPEYFSPLFEMRTGTNFDHVFWKRRFKNGLEKVDPSILEKMKSKTEEPPPDEPNAVAVDKLLKFIVEAKSIEEGLKALESLKEIYHWKAIEAFKTVTENPGVKEPLRLKAREILNSLVEVEPQNELDAYTALTNSNRETRLRAVKHLLKSRGETVRIISYVALHDPDQEIKTKAIEYLIEPLLNVSQRYELALPSGPDQYAVIFSLAISNLLPDGMGPVVINALAHSLNIGKREKSSSNFLQSESAVFVMWKGVVIRGGSPASVTQRILETLRLMAKVGKPMDLFSNGDLRNMPVFNLPFFAGRTLKELEEHLNQNLNEKEDKDEEEEE